MRRPMRTTAPGSSSVPQWRLEIDVASPTALMDRCGGPACWGKLPAHADYIGYGVKADQAHIWQNWIKHRMDAIPAITADIGQKSDKKWVTLQPATNNLRYIACAFILPPGALSFAPQRYVVGTMMPSSDRIGRAHVFLVYQQVQPQWIQHYWGTSSSPQDWLFWLARMITELVMQQMSDDTVSKTNKINTVIRYIKKLWALHTPGWKQVIGMPVHRPSNKASEHIIQGIGEYSVIGSLRGVRYLPWADWPNRILRSQPVSAFWQQDHAGKYVNAAETLEELWEKAWQL